MESRPVGIQNNWLAHHIKSFLVILLGVTQNRRHCPCRYRHHGNNNSSLYFNPTALGTAKTLWSFGRCECSRVFNTDKLKSQPQIAMGSIAHSLSLSTYHHPDMTVILLKRT